MSEYYRHISGIKDELRYLKSEGVSPWTVIKAMIKREPGYGGMGLWSFIECAMLGWQIRNAAHDDIPTSAPRNTSEMPKGIDI